MQEINRFPALYSVLYSVKYPAFCALETSLIKQSTLRVKLIPPPWGSVVCDHDKLGFSLADGLQGLFVAQHILATFHHQGKARVDALYSLFL